MEYRYNMISIKASLNMAVAKPIKVFVTIMSRDLYGEKRIFSEFADRNKRSSVRNAKNIIYSDN